MSGILWALPSRIGVDEGDGEGRGMGEGSNRVDGGEVLRELGRSLLVGCGYGNGGGDDEDGGSGSLVGGSGHGDDGGGAPVASVVGASHTDKVAVAVVAVGQGSVAVAVGYKPTALASSPPLHSQHPPRQCS